MAWELGVIDGLRTEGVDVVGRARQVIGTSAGAAVGAQLTTGTLADAIDRLLSNEESFVDFDMSAYQLLIADILANADSGKSALVRIGEMALEASTVSEAERRGRIAARLPVAKWSANHELLITAVDALTGDLVLFDRNSEVEVVDAVAASCAVPGIWPPTTIRDRRYIDGGVRSLTNADLVQEAGCVLVLVPTRLSAAQRSRLARETNSVDRVVVLEADRRSMEAIGPNPLDPSVRGVTLAAGRVQGAYEAARVESLFG